MHGGREVGKQQEKHILHQPTPRMVDRPSEGEVQGNLLLFLWERVGWGFWEKIVAWGPEQIQENDQETGADRKPAPVWAGLSTVSREKKFYLSATDPGAGRSKPGQGESPVPVTSSTFWLQCLYIGWQHFFFVCQGWQEWGMPWFDLFLLK